jgi:hypothetical protein
MLRGIDVDVELCVIEGTSYTSTVFNIKKKATDFKDNSIVPMCLLTLNQSDVNVCYKERANRIP